MEYKFNRQQTINNKKGLSNLEECVYSGVHKKLLSIIFLIGVVFTSQTFAATFSYTATNLTDTNVGEDLWQYKYQVSEETFNTDSGFTIWFDYGLYDNISPASSSVDSSSASFAVSTFSIFVLAVLPNIFDIKCINHANIFV